MTQIPERGRASPFLMLWLSPRETIERIVASQPQPLVVIVLAVLGAIAGLYCQLAALNGGAPPANAWFWLGLIVGGGIYGIVWLYLDGSILTWIGGLLGGHASAPELRAALAWSGVPVIAGFLLLAVGALLGPPAAGIVTSLIVAVFGIWSLVVFLLMLGRLQHFGFWRTIAFYVLNLAAPLVLAFAVRTLLFQPFNIPARSMVPTLLVGDYLFVSKYAYGYTHYSLPYSPPLFSGRIFASEPRRGDVVVFRLPKNDKVDYVKRIIGLPGDRIQMKAGALFINDAPVQRERLADFTGDDPCGGSTAPVKRWRETLDTGVSYETLDCIDNGFYDNTNVYTVPSGHFFMMGDNRDNSTDSRVMSAVGYIPFENIIGRAGMIFVSRKEDGEIRRERIGTVVR